MSQYPNLSEHFPDADENLSLTDTDSDDSDAEVNENVQQRLDDCRYDEYGELICVGAVTVAPLPTTPGPSEPTGSTENSPSATHSGRHAQGKSKKRTHPQKEEIRLKRDSHGKLGIKIRRMGKYLYFSFVEVGSPAARAGIGFGDQLLALNGIDLSSYTGSRLMDLLSRSKASEFQMTVGKRPYDFDIEGVINHQGDLIYNTRHGKPLGSVKLLKVLPKGHVNHLQLLSVNGRQLLGCNEMEWGQAFKSAKDKLQLRVMPRDLSSHLLKHQDKTYVRNKMQLSSPSTAG